MDTKSASSLLAAFGTAVPYAEAVLTSGAIRNGSIWMPLSDVKALFPGVTLGLRSSSVRVGTTLRFYLGSRGEHRDADLRQEGNRAGPRRGFNEFLREAGATPGDRVRLYNLGSGEALLEVVSA